MSFQTSTTSAPVPSPSQKPDGFTGNSSSNLYLITFLATLFLLLFLSSAIVLRSYLRRRRWQRQFDEAAAAGYTLSPRSPGSRKHYFGVKPKIYHAWVTQGGHKWCEMMPISALPVQVKRQPKNVRSISAPSSSQPLSIPPPQPFTLHQRFFRPVRTFHRQPPPEPSPSVIEPEKPPKPNRDALQVSVLISMPSPARPVNISTSTLVKPNDEEYDEMLPEVVFGVTRLPYKPPEQTMTIDGI